MNTLKQKLTSFAAASTQIFAGMLASLIVLLSLLIPTASTQAQEGTWNIEFSWPASACDSSCVSVDGYRLSVVGGGVVADTANVLGTVVSDYALTVGQEYCFTVAGYNSAGESPQSDPACLTVSQTVPSKTTLIINFPVVGL